MIVKTPTARKCLSCDTPLSRTQGIEGLCPGCLIEMALDVSSMEAELLAAPGEASTLQFAPDQTFSEGDIHGERYRIRSLLGRGGMGEVWRAYDLKLRLDVALKALRTELIADERALKMLRQEVRVAREVISPNVCRVFDLQEVDGQELISMEYVEGTTLQETLRERGPLELNEAREIAAQFLAGLEAIHDAGLIHRDIKPENLMITRTGRVVVMDFGIAKGLGEGISGAVAGTPAYMSPEQKRGGEQGARADLFSVGVVLAEMVEPGGLHSFEDRQRVWEGIHRDIPEVAQTPWAKVIERAISADPKARFDSASALARALEEVTLRAAGDETVQPYPGLSAFQQEDTEFFYGRELEVEALWKKLRRPHLLAVIGPSGAGKSSFLRAGLLPTLTDGWDTIIATPGNRPFANLARALAEQLPGDSAAVDGLLRLEEPDVAVDLISRWRQGHQRGLLILDQFEELFTQNSEEIQSAFAELLGRLPLEADVHVLLSMRDDFLFHCQSFEPLAPVFSEMTPLGPPTGASLRRAIVQPALKCGYRFEDEAIVEEMLGEVEGQRGALPLLAFAAAQLWERRDRETGLLTRKSYEEIGGVGGALAQHAEAMLDYIGESNTPIVRELFRNLVTAQGTRAARDREELLSVFGVSPTGKAGSEAGHYKDRSGVGAGLRAGPSGDQSAAEEVLNTLIDARLLTSYEVPATDSDDAPHQRIEIVHESLLASWPRLVRWQTQDAQGAQLRDELRSQARLWDEHGGLEDYLWTGTAFKEYALWRESYPGGLTEAEEAFGAAMVHLAERRKRRRRIAVTVVIAALIVGLTIVGSFWRQAERETRRAEAGKLIALGEIEIDTFPTATLAWATKSLELADTLEGRLLAMRAIQAAPPVTVTELDFGQWWNLAFSPNGEWLANAGFQKVKVRNQVGGEPETLAEYVSLGRAPKLAFQSGDVLVVDEGGDFRWLSVSSGDELRRVEADRGRLVWPGGDGYFSFLEAEGQGSILWWPFEGEGHRRIGSMPDWKRPKTEAAQWELPEWSAEWSAIDIDPSGSWLAYSRETEAYLRSLKDWNEQPVRLGAHQTSIVELAIDPDGSRVASRDESGEIRIWSVAVAVDGAVRTFSVEGSRQIGFDPTGRWLASHGMVGGSVKVHLWDLTAPQGAEPIVLARTGLGAVFAVDLTFHPSKPWLVTANQGNAAFWPLPDRHPWILRGHEGRVDAVAFTPGGDWLLSAAGDGVRAWPLRGQNAGAPRVLLDRPLVSFTGLAIHPSGEYFAVGSRQATVLVVPVDGGPAREMPGSWEAVGGGMRLDFSPDGRHLAAVPWWGPEGDLVIRAWNLESGEVRVLDPDMGPGPGTNSLYFDDDTKLRWVGQDNENYSEFGDRVFDLVDGSVEKETRVQGFENQASRALSRDGLFFLASRNDQLIWQHRETGEARSINSHGMPTSVTIDPTDSWIVTGGWTGMVQVGPITGEEPHLLLGHRGLVRSVAVSPNGRWIASGGDDATVRLWPTPDLSKSPLHALRHDELIAKLQSLTNVFIAEDPDGWNLDDDHFPGWQEVPEW